MPIGFTLMLTALIFIGHIRGIQVGFNVIATDIYRTTGSYSWSVLTFFVLLGFFCLAGNFGKDLYFAAYRWLGRMPGGLAIATIGACTALAAIVGDGTSPVITMTSVALPEMRRYKYDDSLSAGSIMAGATLGPIIPPSVLFVIYGTLAQLSIGKLLVAGIFPGLLISGLFIITIYVLCLIKPKLGPAGEKSTWIQKLTALKAGAPVAVMFLVVIGGIYLGVFTPTEGGAMGVAAAIVIGFIERRFTMKSLLQAITNGGRTIAMSFCILIGALMFCRFIAWCNISGTATEFLKGLNMSPYAVAGLALFIFFLLGFVVDMLTLMLIGVPIMIPIAAAFGFNPIWWAVLMVLTINLGTITPPVAITLWVLKGTAPDIPMSNLYKGALYFVLPLVIAIVIIFFVPAISSWLPSLSFMK
jgi:tripartite ATP-independent transporter DctM subunit